MNRSFENSTSVFYKHNLNYWMEPIEIRGKNAGETTELYWWGFLIFVLFILSIVYESGGTLFIMLLLLIPFGVHLWSYVTIDLLCITLSEQGVRIGSENFFRWNEIHSYRIYKEETVDGISHFLALRPNATEEYKYNIGHMEKSVEEIELLFKQYSRRSDWPLPT